jgi:restriction system protein
LLPWLSGLWLALAVLTWLLAAVADVTPVSVQLSLAAGVVGFGVFVVTGWAMVAWQRFRPRRQAPDQGLEMALEDLLALSPSEFEAWVQQLFRSRGYFTRNTPDSGDHGVDLWVVSPQGEQAVVQCKRYRGVVSESTVRELYGVMQHEGTPRGFLVTTGSISAAAGRWAQGKPIELIDGPRLAMLASGQVDPSEPLAGKGTAVDV